MTRIVRGVLAVMLAAFAPAMTAQALPMDNCPALGSETAQVMVDVDSTFARTKPDFNAPTLTRLIKFQCFYAIGRNQIGDFVLVRDGASKLWISEQDIATRGDVGKLPVTPEVVGGSSITISRNVRGLPAVGPRARQIYANSASGGRDLGIVTVMGDCNSEPPVYFGRLASGAFNPAAYGLGNAAYRFSRSWARWSLATSGSFNTGSALDASWSNPKKCNANETPLACELRDSRASILIISLGTGDQFAWQQFPARLSQIVNETIANNVLPVLITKADALESQQGGAPKDSINNAIRAVGAQYGVPVIDLAIAAAELPNGGLANEPPPQFHLSAEGETLKMVMTLATLEQIASGVAYSPPAATSAPPAPAPGAPTPAAATATPTASGPAVAAVTSPAPPPGSPAAAVFRLRVSGANLRSGPSTTAEVLSVANSGTELPLLARSPAGDWVQLRLSDGRAAWVLANLGDVAEANAAPPSSLAQAVVVRTRGVMRSAPSFDSPERNGLQTGQMLELASPAPKDGDAEWVSVRMPGTQDDAWVHRDQLRLIGRP